MAECQGQMMNPGVAWIDYIVTGREQSTGTQT